MQSSVHHTCNDPDGDKRNLPDADTHPALCPDEDDDENIALSSFVQFVSLAQSCSFHSSVFHFLALFVILLALANIPSRVGIAIFFAIIIIIFSSDSLIR